MTEPSYDEQQPTQVEEERPQETGVAPPPAADAAEPSTEAEAEAAEQQAEQELEDELTVAQRAVGELTADLQRLQAEFLNYKRRVDRDRELIRENATYVALTPIIDVLDTIDRAREHAELDGGFKAVAEQLERVVSGLGLTKFGEPGDPFDPTVHEALSHIGEDPEVTVTTCKVVAKAGYRMGERVVRAAQVLVVDPPSGPTE
ncbi:nucleotide exchange factor GrpE [Nocardioides sp.]|uniref:nucleotide exchange factor GrpE n=1 Tax=Nocardioides sp. TaxID=35761 RepID=UPI0025DAE0DF|nr:nucleotide exchange factor GrpE [Nocardioides sp.]